MHSLIVQFGMPNSRLRYFMVAHKDGRGAPLVSAEILTRIPPRQETVAPATEVPAKCVEPLSASPQEPAAPVASSDVPVSAVSGACTGAPGPAESPVRPLAEFLDRAADADASLLVPEKV